jgi:GntR family transcriptional regulator
MTLTHQLMPVSRHATPKPLYAQVREMLFERIRAGEWSAGETLPNEFALSEAFGVSIGTIRRAVAELENNGILVRKQGRGTYVAGTGSGALEHKFSTLRSPQGQPIDIGYELVSMQPRLADPGEAAALALASDGRVVEVVQHVTVADRTVGIEISVLAQNRFPRLDTQLRYGQHLYPVLADYGCLVTSVQDALGLETPADIARRIGQQADTPFLFVRRTAFSLDGEAVELRKAYYIAGRVIWVCKVQ